MPLDRFSFGRSPPTIFRLIRLLLLSPIVLWSLNRISTEPFLVVGALFGELGADRVGLGDELGQFGGRWGVGLSLYGLVGDLCLFSNSFACLSAKIVLF